MKKTAVLSLIIVCTLVLAGCNLKHSTDLPLTNASDIATSPTPKTLAAPLPWESSIYNVLFDKSVSFDPASDFSYFESIAPFFDRDEAAFNIAEKVCVNFAGYELDGVLNGFSMERDLNSTAIPCFSYKVSNENTAKIDEFHLDDEGRIVAVYTDEREIDSSYDASDEKTIQQLRESADDFLKDNFTDCTDPSTFRLTDVENGNDYLLVSKMRRYSFTYTKFIDDIETDERIVIEFNINGRLSRYESNFLGRVEAEVDMSKVDMNKVNDKLNKAIDNVYEGQDGYARSYNNILFLGIYILDDGSLGAYYHVKVNLKPANANSKINQHYVLINIIPNI